MQDLRTPAQEAAEDVFFGQLVMIWARWFLILAGIILTLWTANTTSELSVALIPIVALMLMNFFLHGRYVVERPANRLLTIASGALDITIVTLIILLWPSEKGLLSPYYIFYYPLILAFAFVFAGRYTLIYTLVVLAAYTAVCLLTDATWIRDSQQLETFVMRLITLAAMGFLGSFYWRIQRERRRSARPTSTVT